MIVTTSNSIENFKINEHLGIVFASRIISAGITADIMAKVIDVIGGKSKGYSNAFNNAIYEALEELMSNAKKESADAITGVSIQIATISTEKGAFFVILCYGTAVRGQYAV